MTSDVNVSVIIPCYNQANFLGEAIESALGQSIKPIEVIVIDDGSTDLTPEVAMRYPSVQYIHQKNSGLALARNAGFFASKSDYLIFLDSDDRLPPNSIKAGLLALKDSPNAAFSFGRLRRITIDGCLISERKEPTRTNYYQDLLKDNYIPTPGMVVFRRTALEKFGLFDPKIPATADYDLYLRIVRNMPIVSHRSITVERRVHPQAMSRNAAKMLREVLIAHGRQSRHTSEDKSLREDFLVGRKWWKRWYGNQLLTQIKVERFLGEWRKYAGNVLSLLRFHPDLVKNLRVKARQSNHYRFKFSTENGFEHLIDPEHEVFDPGSEKKSSNELHIWSIELGSIQGTNSQTNLTEDVSLVSIHCENAVIGTRAVFNNMPVAGVTLKDSVVQALLPTKILTSPQKHKLYLLG